MLSENLINLVKSCEGFSPSVYEDLTGVYTIGYGFCHYPDGTPVTADSPIVTIEKANEWLESLLIQFINGVNALAPNLNQNQKDALIDFSYNLGLNSLKNSTLLKYILTSYPENEIRTEFGKWVYAGGKILPGLVTRRAAEAQLFFTPSGTLICAGLV